MKRYRTPSFNKSFSARTTGRATRSIKRACNPYYGKKGSGWVNDPKRAAYNHLYNKTTQSVHDHSSFEVHEYSSFDGGSGFISNCFSFIGVILVLFAGLLEFVVMLFTIAVNIGAFVVLIKIVLFFASIF
jgi:hypothetical protein